MPRPLLLFSLFVLALITLSACRAETPTPSSVTPTPATVSGVTPLAPPLTPEQAEAQSIALSHDELLRFARDPQTAAPLRSQIFGIYPVRESDITDATAACRDDRCYRVEMYNYATNVTYLAWVNLDTNDLLYVSSQPDTQPDLPPALTQKAIAIATTAPEVIEALGFNPAPEDPTMPNIKTALNNTTCERSRHLCVAPTFLVGDRALWAIVDLTDEKLVGIRWTDLGEAQAGTITQQSIENEDVFAQFCQQTNQLERNGWEMDYILTSSDGLRLSDVQFQGQPVVESTKLVDWHVSYSGEDGFGYSDAIGCPIFSAAAVGAHSGPTFEDIVQDGETVGFAVIQDYYHPNWPQPCNYRYVQRYEFYNDGRFRVAAANLGRGCGDNGTYRPVLRIHLAPPAGGYTLAEWDGSDWQDWTTEGWQLQDADTPYTPEDYQYRLMDADGAGYSLEPGQGQFGDGGRGDNAYLYATLYKPDEGDADMVTIGPCCNEDYEQGPEKFIDSPPESIAHADIVLWYVAQQPNDDDPGSEYCWAEPVVEDGVYTAKVWPCTIGPMFTPIKTGAGS